MKRRMLSVLLALALLLSVGAVGSLSVSAAKPTLVVLGDGISAGLGLEGTQPEAGVVSKYCYVNQVAEALYLDTQNWAVEGTDSKALAQRLEALSEEERAVLAQADYSSITVGGEELQALVLRELATALALDPTEEGFAQKVLDAQAQAETDPAIAAQFTAAQEGVEQGLDGLADEFQVNFDAILFGLLENNPEATVILQTIPYGVQQVEGFEDVIALGVDKLNQIIRQGAGETAQMVLVETNRMLDSTGAGQDLYFDPQMLVQFHPNQTGHGAISALMRAALRPPHSFTDIESHWASWSIAYAAQQKYMAGTGETTFTPNGKVTRGMVVTVLGRMAGIDKDEYVDYIPVFLDVDSDKYYAPYVTWAEEAGIVKGTSALTFEPDAIIERQALATLLSRFAEYMAYPVNPIVPELAFSDEASIGSYAKKAVTQMQTAGVLSGKGDNTFAPKEGTSRGELATVIFRFDRLIRVEAGVQ